jgi:hypothetical protein
MSIKTAVKMGGGPKDGWGETGGGKKLSSRLVRAMSFLMWSTLTSMAGMLMISIFV